MRPHLLLQFVHTINFFRYRSIACEKANTQKWKSAKIQKNIFFSYRFFLHWIMEGRKDKCVMQKKMKRGWGNFGALKFIITIEYKKLVTSRRSTLKSFLSVAWMQWLWNVKGDLYYQEFCASLWAKIVSRLQQLNSYEIVLCHHTAVILPNSQLLNRNNEKTSLPTPLI